MRERKEKREMEIRVVAVPNEVTRRVDSCVNTEDAQW